MMIQDIHEVGQYMELKFKLLLNWVDARIVFHNLKVDERFNSLSLEEQLSLWNPKLVFWNTKKELRSVKDEKVFASVRRTGNGTMIDKKINEDIEYFPGSDNPITMSRVYSLKFFCDYNMQWYPFDQQTCSVELIMDGVLDSYAELFPAGVVFTGPQELTQYFVKNYKMKRMKKRGKEGILVSITLGRRLLGRNVIRIVIITKSCS